MRGKPFCFQDSGVRSGLNWLMNGAVLLPLLGALLHPPMGWLFQKGERAGIPMSVTVGVSNLATVLCFALYLRPDWAQPVGWLDGLALLNGLFFFCGQWFTVRAVKAGDLVVHTSALGIKLFLVAGLSLAIGLEGWSWTLLGAVVLGALAIFLLAGGNLRGWREHRVTLGWTLLGTAFFGLGDVLTSWKAAELGTARWLILMMAGSGCCALRFLLPRREVLRDALTARRTQGILFGLGLLMGGQAVLVNTAFAVYQEPTVSNVVFAMRGLLAIPFLMLIRRRLKGVVSWPSFAGTMLMLVALALAVR